MTMASTNVRAVTSRMSTAAVLIALIVIACEGGGQEATPTATAPEVLTPEGDTAAASPSPPQAASGQWLVAAPMPTPRSEIASAVIDGEIFVVGAFLASGVNSDLLEAYDPEADAWETKQPLPVTIDHPAVAAAGGKLYVLGGFRVLGSEISPATYEYDPQADTWTRRTDMPLLRAGAIAVSVNATTPASPAL